LFCLERPSQSLTTLYLGGNEQERYFLGVQAFFVILGITALAFSFLCSIPTPALVFENREMKLMTFAFASIASSILIFAFAGNKFAQPGSSTRQHSGWGLMFALLLAAKFISFTDPIDRIVVLLISLLIFLIVQGVREWYSDLLMGYGLNLFSLLTLGWFFQHSSKLTIDVKSVLS
jgi:hypothetical protein